MDTIILKFGGSSVADNIKLNVVADKIISLKEEKKNIVAVVSAQGKTTDRLLKEAQELSAIPDERELDALLATGEQVTAAKLSILLNRKGHEAVSLTGWQAGIITSKIHKNARIDQIDITRIEEELKKGKIVIVSGFQGIDEERDITTLGRGGSDTTAVALGAALNADKCYIFSDVDGIYTADPNMITMAKRLNKISFTEMQEIADAGAKVLHDRCIHIGEKFGRDIIAKSTFVEKGGTTVCKEIENSEVKSIIKNEDLINLKIELKSVEESFEIYQKLLEENILIETLKNYQNDDKKFMGIRISKQELNKVKGILENRNIDYTMQIEITKLSVVGYGIAQNKEILRIVVNNIKQEKILDVNLSQSKMEVIIDGKIQNEVIEKLHKELIRE